MTSPHHRAAVRIIGDRKQGSGVVINVKDGTAYVLTAEHVVDEDRTVKVLWPGVDNAERLGVVLRTDVGRDLAIVRVQDSPSRTFMLIARPPPDGSQVEMLGFGRGWFRRWLAIAKETKSGDLHVTPGCMCGDSGGAMIHEGRLVGIISGAYLDKFSRHTDTHGSCELRQFVWRKRD